MREDIFPGERLKPFNARRGCLVRQSLRHFVPVPPVTRLQEQIGHAQVAARAENEKIHASADAFSVAGPIPFVCECADPDCSEIVQLDFLEYDAIRKYPRRFFNVTGHEKPAVEAAAEQIVLVAGELTVVDKRGIAGEIAAAAHEPRA